MLSHRQNQTKYYGHRKFFIAADPARVQRVKDQLKQNAELAQFRLDAKTLEKEKHSEISLGLLNELYDQVQVKIIAARKHEQLSAEADRLAKEAAEFRISVEEAQSEVENYAEEAEAELREIELDASYALEAKQKIPAIQPGFLTKIIPNVFLTIFSTPEPIVNFSQEQPLRNDIICSK